MVCYFVRILGLSRVPDCTRNSTFLLDAEKMSLVFVHELSLWGKLSISTPA